MINLSKIEGTSYKVYELPPKEESLINKTLPFIIFLECLSYLNDKDIQSARLVSYLWNEASLDTAKRRKFSMIKGFTNFLCKNLLDKSYKAQKEKILAVGRNILDFVNLSQIRLSMYGSKESILNILKDLNEEDLKSLEDVSKKEGIPEYFDNSFKLATIYRQLDEAKMIANKDQKTIAIGKIVRILLKFGDEEKTSRYFEKALEVANMIPDEQKKCFYLEAISAECRRRHNVEKAFEAAVMIVTMPTSKPEGRYRTYFKVFQDLLHLCLREGYFETAIKIENMIPKEKYNFFIKDILLNFFKTGYTEQAMKIVDVMPNYSDFFEEAWIEFCSNHEKTALAVADTISNKIYKSLALRYTSLVLFHKGNVEEAIGIANTIPEENYRSSTLQDISKALLKGDDTEKKGCIIQ